MPPFLKHLYCLLLYIPPGPQNRQHHRAQMHFLGRISKLRTCQHPRRNHSHRRRYRPGVCLKHLNKILLHKIRCKIGQKMLRLDFLLLCRKHRHSRAGGNPYFRKSCFLTREGTPACAGVTFTYYVFDRAIFYFSLSFFFLLFSLCFLPKPHNLNPKPDLHHPDILYQITY